MKTKTTIGFWVSAIVLFWILIGCFGAVWLVGFHKPGFRGMIYIIFSATVATMAAVVGYILALKEDVPVDEEPHALEYLSAQIAYARKQPHKRTLSYQDSRGEFHTIRLGK